MCVQSPFTVSRGLSLLHFQLQRLLRGGYIEDQHRAKANGPSPFWGRGIVRDMVETRVEWERQAEAVQPAKCPGGPAKGLPM